MKKALLLTLAVLAVGIGLIAVGSSNDSADAKERDRAFLQSMVPHHESAIEMAEIARSRAKTPEMKQLATDIVAAQKREIAQIEAIHQRLFSAELQQDDTAHAALGLSADQAGMNHGSEEQMTSLQTGEPFDRIFIDEMTPHHQGAIAMAKAVLETTEDEEIKRLANGIVAAQDDEVELMTFVRTREYGPASPTPSSQNANPHAGH